MPVIDLETLIRAPVDRCFDLSRNIDSHMELTAHTREVAVAGVTNGLIGLEQEVTWEASHFKFARDSRAGSLPLGILGDLANRFNLRKYMTTLLARRNKLIKEVAEREFESALGIG